MVQSHVAWFPETEADRELVLGEMRSILASHQFRNSKRYPSLLEYLVRRTVDGHCDELKERALGIDVFGRAPDYDTNADPIVRVTAGEVRRRIAQYYHETGASSPLHIELPLGSYAPEFRRTETAASADIQSHAVHGETVETGSVLPQLGAVPYALAATPTQRQVRRWPGYVGLVCALLVILGAGMSWWSRPSASRRLEKGLWGPLLNTSAPVLMVLPSSRHPNASADLQAIQPGSTLPRGPYNRISLSSADSLSRIATLLGSFGGRLDLREADNTVLGDLRERSTVLLGASDNQWTMRLTEQLPYRFVEEPTAVRIVDVKNPANREWVVDYSRPYAEAKRDFALLARYHDPTTGGEILIVAGIGAHATQAAGVFAANSGDMEQLKQGAPKGWESKNIAMIIETDIINGDAGPPRLLAVQVW